MPRIVRHPEDRKAELLDHSLRLFLERGFANTSLNEIIKESGLSKGAFYHYFSSKEVLLEELAARFAAERLRQLNLAPVKPKESALHRLNHVLASLRELRLENIGIPDFAVAALFKSENRELYRRISRAWEAVFRPVFTKVFVDGASQGTFQTDDPEGVADLLLAMIARGRDIVEQTLGGEETINRMEAIRLLDKRAKLHGLAIDRLLGLPDGSVLTAKKGFGRQLITKFTGKKAATPNKRRRR